MARILQLLEGVSLPAGRQALALTNPNFDKGEAGEKKWENL